MFMLCELKSDVEWTWESLAELSWDKGTTPCLVSAPAAFVPMGSHFGTPVHVIFNLGCQGSSFATPLGPKGRGKPLALFPSPSSQLKPVPAATGAEVCPVEGAPVERYNRITTCELQLIMIVVFLLLLQKLVR